MSTKTPPILVDNVEAGRLLDMPRQRVKRLAKRGELPCVALPDGELRYLPSDLVVWVNQHRQLPDDLATENGVSDA